MLFQTEARSPGWHGGGVTDQNNSGEEIKEEAHSGERGILSKREDGLRHR